MVNWVRFPQLNLDEQLGLKSCPSQHRHEASLFLRPKSLLFGLIPSQLILI